MTDALTPILVDDDRRNALLRAVGFDKLSDAQRELALSIAQRYDLDPMLKHLVMIDGRPYITRDGLLHVAHRSGKFDGITTTQPEVVGEFWRASCSVYRKDMTHPFTYSGRYPTKGGNQKFAPEMAVKVAEVMALRRAFDVAAPAFEERWDVETPVVDVADATEPTSLAERVERRAQEVAQDPQGSTQPPDDPAVDANDDVAPDEVLGYDEPAVIISAIGTEAEHRRAREMASAHEEPHEPAGQAAMDAFATWARLPGRDADVVRATAKSLFPDVKQFSSLTVGRLAALTREVETLEEAMGDDDGAPEPVAGQGDTSPEYEAAAQALVGGIDAMTTTPDVDKPAFAPFTKPEMCGNQSPLSDNTCNLDVGHKGIHRASLKETW